MNTSVEKGTILHSYLYITFQEKVTMNEGIRNLATRDYIEFLQTDAETSGRISKFIMTLAPNSSWAKSPRHVHPFQTETFQVTLVLMNYFDSYFRFIPWRFQKFLFTQGANFA